MNRKALPLGAIFLVPVFIALTSLVGLIAALIGNDLWDAVSWLALFTPVAATLWAVAKRRR